MYVTYCAVVRFSRVNSLKFVMGACKANQALGEVLLVVVLLLHAVALESYSSLVVTLIVSRVAYACQP